MGETSNAFSVRVGVHQRICSCRNPLLFIIVLSRLCLESSREGLPMELLPGKVEEGKKGLESQGFYCECPGKTNVMQCQVSEVSERGFW